MSDEYEALVAAREAAYRMREEADKAIIEAEIKLASFEHRDTWPWLGGKL